MLGAIITRPDGIIEVWAGGELVATMPPQVLIDAAAEMKRRCLEVARYQAEIAATGEARQMAKLIAAGIEALPE